MPLRSTNNREEKYACGDFSGLRGGFMLENLQALVLQARPYGEAHRLVTLLTRERSVVRAIAHRAQLQHNHLYAATQELARSLLQLRLAGDSLATVTQGTLLDNYTELRVDMEKLVYSSAVMELLLNMDQSGGRASSADLFDDVVAGLDRMRQSFSPRFVLAHLQLSLLPYFGVALSIADCAQCGAKLERSTEFSFKSGGFLCAQCAVRTVELRPVVLVPGVWRIMKQMTGQRIARTGRVSLLAETEEQACDLLTVCLRDYAGVSLRSLRVAARLHELHGEPSQPSRGPGRADLGDAKEEGLGDA
ncbi:MAG: DNA repair protein RecO [Bacilli bacterium]